LFEKKKLNLICYKNSYNRPIIYDIQSGIIHNHSMQTIFSTNSRSNFWVLYKCVW